MVHAPEVFMFGLPDITVAAFGLVIGIIVLLLVVWGLRFREVP
jgi:hypothetical protein